MLKIALTVNAGSYKFVGKKEGRGMKYGEGLHRGLGAYQRGASPLPQPLARGRDGKKQKGEQEQPQSWPKPANTWVRVHLQLAR